MLTVTVSQVVALLSSALCGSGGGVVAVGTKVSGAAADGERCQRCGGHDRAAWYCCVCISACGDGEEIRTLPCGHAFHRDCVDRWLARRRRTCPLCRTHVGAGALAMLAVTVSQVVALLSSALSGAEGGGGVAVGTTKQVAGATADGERWPRCGGGHDRAAGYCCVCISACRDGEEIRSLPCGHAFHRDCVDRWLARCRRTCPLCRLHVGGGAMGVVDEVEQQQLSEDLVIWFSSLFVAGL
ncbi:hypothetical protein BAE44_0021278 [Dichanthelium oligosanthes]|uniref:RING-type E3 ubiquitin transferase n=1 Tax=Dichanthelium oligosanthes TaxID=888268 RepID=A0A1E5UXT4_9POAL|nr:hypothetical protein BAE44_0021278 [Dichanthelium oligosanthes]